MPKRHNREQFQPLDEFSFDPAWLAGIFEVAGSLCFVKNTKILTNGEIQEYTYPLMALTDEKHVIEQLPHLIGGNVRRYVRSQTSYVWDLKGSKAVDLAQTMERYAPSRQEIITAFTNWERGESPEEKSEIAGDQQRRGLNLSIQETDYIDLIQNPNFVAGVVDARSHSYSLQNRGGGITRMQVLSKNGSLLGALHGHHGGSLAKSYSRGESRNIFGRECIIKHDSFSWTIEGDNLQELSSFVQAYLYLRSLPETE